MDPLLLIIKYIYKKKNINNNDESVDAFFENGLSFPQFVSIVCGVKEIPKVKKNPTTESDKKMNNDITLQYLCQINEDIKKSNPTYSNKSDKEKLLVLIFTKLCFKIDIKEIISKCNLILQPFNIKFVKKSDIITINCILSLLNVLTDGKVHFDHDLNETKNFDDLINSFSQANVPLVINESCLKEENQDIFLIQLEIIFEFFSSKISEIEKNSQKFSDQKASQKVHDEDEEEEEEEECITGELDDENQFLSYEENDWKNINPIRKERKKRRFNSSSSSDDDIDHEEMLEDSLLKTINYIGRGKFHFSNLHEAVINDSIPRFVMFFFNLKSIKNVHLKPIKSATENNQKITKEEIDNINAVLEFLKTKETRYKILQFDFENPLTEENSAYMFYSNFLNYFFVKTLKSEIYERIAILLCTKETYNDEDYIELTNVPAYAALLHFYIHKNLHFDYSELPEEIEQVEPLFDQAKIPMIITDKILWLGWGCRIVDPVYYQCQFIFNAIDSGPKSLSVVEKFLKVIYSLKKIKVPNYSEISESILAKRTSLEFQNVRSDEYLKRTDSKNHSESSENIQKEPVQNETKISSYRNRQKENKNDQNNPETVKSSSGSTKSFDQFWKLDDSNYLYDKGIVYDQSKYQANKSNDLSNWMKETSNIQKNTKRKSLIKDSENLISFKSSQNSYQTRLYKIFLYDETSQEWTYQSEVFQVFAIERRINIDDSKTPIVLLLNSYEDELIDLTSNLITSKYPPLESEEDIFVYPLCDKVLSMLNFYVDFNDKEKSGIKPIFLLLHIPKSKSKLINIHQIIFEIYTFLSLISDLQIVILNKNHYVDQIDSTKCIRDISNSFRNSFNQVKDDIKISSDNDDSDDQNDENDEYEEDLWEDKNETDFIKDDNIHKILCKNSKVIVLINDSSINYNLDIESNLNKNKFFQDLKSQIGEENAIHCININEPDSYESFLKSFNDILINESSKFSEVKSNFDCISLSKMSLFYTQIRRSGSSWEKCLKEMILSRNKEFESNDENSFDIISKLSKEISRITPSIDNEFSKKCNEILLDLNSEKSKKNREFYSSELLKSAQSHLECLNERLNKRYFWTEEQMDLMMKTHFSFLKDEFFDIIQLTSSEKNYNILYEENYDILEKQFDKSKLEINKFFEPFIEKIRIKNNPKEQDIKDKIQKGANYCMKETENMREVKIAVQINEDLKSEIEQDF